MVVVTGGAGLLGRRFCAAIAANDGVAAIADCDLDRARQVADEIAQQHPGKVSAVTLDITDKESITQRDRYDSRAPRGD